MERGVHVVGYGPPGVHVGISALDMVVGQEVREAQLFDPMAVGAHRAAIAAQFCLWKHHIDPHNPHRIRTVTGGFRHAESGAALRSMIPLEITSYFRRVG